MHGGNVLSALTALLGCIALMSAPKAHAEIDFLVPLYWKDFPANTEFATISCRLCGDTDGCNNVLGGGEKKVRIGTFSPDSPPETEGDWSKQTVLVEGKLNAGVLASEVNGYHCSVLHLTCDQGPGSPPVIDAIVTVGSPPSDVEKRMLRGSEDHCQVIYRGLSTTDVSGPVK